MKSNHGFYVVENATTEISYSDEIKKIFQRIDAIGHLRAKMHAIKKLDQLRKTAVLNVLFERSELRLHVKQFLFSLDEHLSGSTLKQYESSLRIGWFVTVADFAKVDFWEWFKDAIGSDRAKTTVDNICSHWSAFSKYLYRRRLVCRSLKYRKRVRSVEYKVLPLDSEIEQLPELCVRFAKQASGKHRVYRSQFDLIIRLLIETGARVGEIQNLRWSDVDFHEERGLLLLRGTKTEAARRTVKISPMLSTLIELRGEKTGRKGLIFRSLHGEQLPNGATYQILRTISINFRLSVVINPHLLRYQWILTQVASGASAIEMMMRLGHSDVSMTVRYFNMVRRYYPHLSPNVDSFLMENAQTRYHSAILKNQRAFQNHGGYLGKKSNDWGNDSE